MNGLFCPRCTVWGDLRLFGLDLVRDPWAALVLARLEIRRLTRAGPTRSKLNRRDREPKKRNFSVQILAGAKVAARRRRINLFTAGKLRGGLLSISTTR